MLPSVDDLGNELPQRMTITWVLVGFALLLLVPTVRTAARAVSADTGGQTLGFGATALVMAALFVVTPLLVARANHQRHVYVSDEAVTVVSGTDRTSVAFDDLREVRVRVSGTGGAFANQKVFLVAGGADGERRVLSVSRYSVETIQPLLRRLATEVEQRPELLDGDLERGYFEDALRSAP